MNIKKSQLVQIIETVVRECIAERRKQWGKQRLSEAGLTSETVSLEDIVQRIMKRGVKKKDDILKLAKALYLKQAGTGTDEKEIDEVVEFHLKEASYKVVSPNSIDTAKEDKARTIQTDPKVNEASYKVVAPKSATDAKEDKARKIQTEPKVNEASYKVAAPHSVDTAKEDKARTIQTDPKVNETAFKKQGPSLKTFKDSPQFPEAVNDPENQ